ncbi:MAG: hypothetical protein DRP38_09420 [Thermotogae bacterium]|nr:MAG: hypothetical protein DRP38_09420 [Thermotogota bacterium]
MKIKIKKVDVAIMIITILVAFILFYRAGYVSPKIVEEEHVESQPPLENFTVQRVPEPPPSFIIPSRRTLTSIDEGCHYKSILVSREWWYFSAIFNESSDLDGWGVMVSFNHMAYGDMFGQFKPDILTVVLYDDSGNTYGGVTNAYRGTLEATTPGVDVCFKNTWAEGKYPRWHVHAETRDVEYTEHTVVIDLDFFAHALPIWTFNTKLLINESDSKFASYVILGCEVSGQVTIDGKIYSVEGTGFHGHSWSPIYMRKFLIGGWDWIQVKLSNGWVLYISKFYPSPRVSASIDPFGTLLISTGGDSITEFNIFDLEPKVSEKIFLFTRFPARYTLSAKKTHNILLERIDLRVNLDIKTTSTYQKVWKFPTYVGFKVGKCIVNGSISWLDGEQEISVDLDGEGSVCIIRMLP